MGAASSRNLDGYIASLRSSLLDLQIELTFMEENPAPEPPPPGSPLIEEAFYSDFEANSGSPQPLSIVYPFLTLSSPTPRWKTLTDRKQRRCKWKVKCLVLSSPFSFGLADISKKGR